MKKSIKTLIIANLIGTALLFATSVHAQFSGGIRAGANLATEKYPGFTMQNAVLGYGGAFATYQLNPIAFQLEADYSGEGGNLKAAFSGQINKYRETYLNVPLLVQAWFPSGAYVEFGGQEGFLTSSTYNFNNNGNVNTRSIYKNTNFSIGGGAGYEFQKRSAKGLSINFRFMQGLTAISSSGSGSEAITTNAFSLGLSERF
ncbi:MAG TPA: outer membrane beta-barrel protein [Mucilaginibacter sp.]|jgi:hypothetical protein